MSVSTQTYRGFGAGGGIDALVRRGFASYTGLTQPPPSGFQYGLCTATYAGTGYSLESAAIPSMVVNSDIFVTSAVTSPNNFIITIDGDGTVVIAAGGNNSRQDFFYSFYRVATNQFDPNGYGLVWVNELAPIWLGAVSLQGPFSLTVGIAMAPISLSASAYAQSPSGDALTFALVSGSLPPGITLTSAGVLSGVSSLVGPYNFVIRATDVTGTSTNSQTNTIVVSTNQSFSSVMATIEALSASSVPVNPVISYAYSSTVPNGFVISQNPPAGSTISPGSSVQITVSMGAANPSNSTNIPNVVGKHVYFAQNAIVAASSEVGTITYQISSTIAAAYVISQSPVARGPVPLWQPVNLVVSSGPPQTFPNTANPVVPPLP